MPFWTRRRYFFFAVPELGFKWCLAVSHALPRSCIFGFSRLGCAMCFVYVLGLFSSSEGVFKGAVLDPPQVLFFAVPELGFKWCLAVSHALPRSCVFGFSRLGCAMFFVYVLGLFSSS